MQCVWAELKWVAQGSTRLISYHALEDSCSVKHSKMAVRMHLHSLPGMQAACGVSQLLFTQAQQISKHL